MNIKGFQYPIFKNPLGFFFSQEGNANIKADLIQLILTNPGDRVMLPLYGTPLRKYIFEQNIDSVRASIRNDVINAISIWEPRITVKEISVDVLEETNPESGMKEQNERGVLIKINYINPEQINNVQRLVLAVPFQGV